MIFNMVGGGASLNYEVIGGTSTPSNPNENTIWVNTSTTITSHVISATAPSSPASGMVWIKNGEKSNCPFSATEENLIMICPLTAYQYASGAWVEKTAKIYQNGAWKDWFTALYNKGDECTTLTGGWKAYAYKTNSSGSTAGTPTVTKGTTTIKIAFSASSSRAGALFTENAIDLTNITTLEIDVVDVGSTAETVFLGISAEKKNNYSPAARQTIYEKGTAILDVSEFTGSYYVYVSMQGAGTNHVEFERICMR